MSVAGLFILKNWWKNSFKADNLQFYLFLKMFQQMSLRAIQRQRKIVQNPF